MEASRLNFPSISFDFLKKTKESACQALLPNWRGIPYVEGGAGDTGEWDLYVNEFCEDGERCLPPDRVGC